MLVLSRNPSESIAIGDNIEVEVIEVRGRNVRLGIKAPEGTPVYRTELDDEDRRGIKRRAKAAELQTIWGDLS